MLVKNSLTLQKHIRYFQIKKEEGYMINYCTRKRNYLLILQRMNPIFQKIISIKADTRLGLMKLGLLLKTI